MIEKLNLACNIKLTEQDEKYRSIHDYIYFRSLIEAIKKNHQALVSDIEDLVDINIKTDQETIFESRGRVQNSLQNLLNSHKMLTDILKRRYEKSEPKIYSRFKIVASHYYDENFDYRIFEALRNYCQHASTVPIDIFSDFEGVTYLFINKQQLGKDEQISKKIKKELESHLHIELNSIVLGWISVVSHIYGLILDYFAYMARPALNDYLEQLATNTIALRSDPLIAETMQSVEVKVIKTIVLFPVLPDPRMICREISERLTSAEHAERHSQMKDIFLEIRSFKNSSRRMKKLGANFDMPEFDTLFIKTLNNFLKGSDPF